MSKHVGYYSEFWGDCIPLCDVKNIDPALGGVGDQLHKQMRVRYPSYTERDMSYTEFNRDWKPVYLGDGDDE
jgi:hypothetical protein